MQLNQRTYPEALPLTLAGVAEHMRADALGRVFHNGPDDVIAGWLWRLAERIEAA